MSVRSFDASDTMLDADVVRAIAWCRIGGPKTRPHHDGAFHAAEELGLLAHDPIWRATPQGEGVLTALGFLDPTWVKERQRFVVLWAREPREGAPAQFVRAWSDGFAEAWSETWEREKEQTKDEWRTATDQFAWLFWCSNEEIGRP